MQKVRSTAYLPYNYIASQFHMPYVLPILFLLFISTTLFGQDDKFYPDMFENSLTIKEGWLVSNGHQDTSLRTREYYNDRGYRTRIEIHRDSLGTTAYEYDYNADNKLITRRTLFSDTPAWTANYSYNAIGNLVCMQDIDPKYPKATARFEIKYDQKNRKREERLILGGKRVSLTRYTYFKNDSLKATKIYEPIHRSKTIKYDRTGKCLTPSKLAFQPIDIKKNTDTSAWESVHIETKRANEDLSTLGTTGYIKLKNGDTLRTEKYYDQDNLLQLEIQYRNEKKIGTKIFKYTNTDR